LIPAIEAVPEILIPPLVDRLLALILPALTLFKLELPETVNAVAVIAPEDIAPNVLLPPTFKVDVAFNVVNAPVLGVDAPIGVLLIDVNEALPPIVASAAPFNVAVPLNVVELVTVNPLTDALVADNELVPTLVAVTVFKPELPDTVRLPELTLVAVCAPDDNVPVVTALRVDEPVAVNVPVVVPVADNVDVDIFDAVTVFRLVAPEIVAVVARTCGLSSVIPETRLIPG
jgi:hypothetical protein